MTLERSDIDRLVRQMEELTMEAHVVWQAVDEARTEIVHELRKLFDKPVESPETNEEFTESLACLSCDCDSPTSLAEALRQGWREIRADDAPMWNFIGLCPGCQATEQREATETIPLVKARESRSQGELF